MSILVPGRGSTCFLQGVPATTYFGVLGPFTDGAFLRRVELQVCADAAGAGQVGAVLGASDEATEVAYRAGKGLIDRSTVYGYGSPRISFHFSAGLSPPIVLYPGIEVQSGSRFCIVYFLSGAGPAVVQLIVTAETLEPGDA
jgi:hypothetical protein